MPVYKKKIILNPVILLDLDVLIFFIVHESDELFPNPGVFIKCKGYRWYSMCIRFPVYQKKLKQTKNKIKKQITPQKANKKTTYFILLYIWKV